ncbi:MAG: Trm112 family protein [Planctomycetota bacterium]
MVDPKLLEILACPYCKEGVREEDGHLVCTRAECGMVYSVEDGIPIMLIEEAAKPCPKCGQEREFSDEELRCPACEIRYRYEP